MKKVLTVILSAAVSIASAQWIDVNNNFEDSLHMPVSTAPSTQKNPITLTSYPDGGYFVIWEDDRNTATTKTDIYAQKFDKNGNRLWTVDGVPVSNGPNSQHYTFSSNQDYRNRHNACTDSAGGFYISYSDDSVSSYVWERLMIQHVRSNGTKVFPGPGYLLITSGAANLNLASQVIADGNKGFFVVYKTTNGNDYINAYCYRDENGILKYYGGARMNENAIQTSTIAPCGIRTDVIYPGTTVSDFNIWSDGNGGCNIIMAMSGNTLGQHQMLCYNRLWRAKKDSKSKVYFRNSSGAACPRTNEYQKGDVYPLYYIVRDFQNVACGGGTGPLYEYTNYRLLANGYQLIDVDGYDYNYPKGVTLTTTNGNINADMIAVTRRTYANNTVSDFTVQGYLYSSEKFDSIPYQRTSYNNPDFGYNSIPPFGMNKLNFFRDTILAFSTYYADFSLAAGGNHIYATGLMGANGARFVRLQNLELSKKSTDSFALEYKTNIVSTPQKPGVAIGQEVSTGFSGDNISYDHPLVAINDKGKGLFYIREYYRSARVSPIGSGAELSWGAMGKPISTGAYNGSYYNLEQPIATLDSLGTSGFITWRDNKFIPGNSGDNIFMRHLDKLEVFNYMPPIKKLKQLYYFSSETFANPAVLLGSSKQYSTIEVYNSYNSTGTSPVVEIKDNNYLGRVQVHVYQHVGTPRRYNDYAYLNRNYTIKTDSLPPNASIDMLLYFTKAEFDALKGTDNSIIDPGFLTVVRQPNTTASAPAAYTPVAGEELLAPVTWDSVSGGYVIKIITTGFGNFFIKKIATVSICSSTATSFTSNVAGAGYQWQVSINNGAGYTNISNNTNYSGATTATLHLTNIPPAFSGYLYRCVVDNVKVSNTFYLQVANVWTGAVNNLWETAGNWSCNTLPTAATDVIINSGTPTVNSTTAICRSIKLAPGASVNITSGFKLTVAH